MYLYIATYIFNNSLIIHNCAKITMYIVYNLNFFLEKIREPDGSLKILILIHLSGPLVYADPEIFLLRNRALVQYLYQEGRFPTQP